MAEFSTENSIALRRMWTAACKKICLEIAWFRYFPFSQQSLETRRQVTESKVAGVRTKL